VAAGKGKAAPSAAVDLARPPIKIFLSQPGIYRVSYEDLVSAGWPAREVASASLHLRHGEADAPISVDDGGDGRFGAGDAVIFAGDRLPGAHGYYNEYSSLNVYWLSGDPAAPEHAAARLQPGKDLPMAASRETTSRWQRRIRMEEDRLLLRYPQAGLEDQELWYWQKLSYLDKDQFAVTVDLPDLANEASETASSTSSPEEAAGAIRITVELRGWSRPRSKPSPDFADHAVVLLWDGAVVGGKEWSGTDSAVRVEAELPAASVQPGVHHLSLLVPERPAADDLPLVDVSILNWIEIVAPRVATLVPVVPLAAGGGPEPGAEAMPATATTPGQLRIEPRPADSAGPAAVTIPANTALEIFTDSGERYRYPARPGRARSIELAAASPSWVVFGGRFLAPLGLELVHPSHWKSPDHQADYLLVVHPRLADSVAPLVALRRRQGLEVAQVDVREIYNEWSAGIADPRAIRDFVDYAYHHWRAPAPRFLLLVGDASWDGKNDRPTAASPDWAFRLSRKANFVENGSTRYRSDILAASRNLIPTWGYGTAEGHAAGDNAFVAIDGDDELPDLAVGRFPVVAPAEVEAIVAKIVQYETAPVPGDWHSRILWVTNEEKHTQQSSDILSAEVAERGFSSRKIYPLSVVPPTPDDQVALRKAFDEGALIVHFFGHGGRYIWRTGPPDLASQRDLFDLADVEALAPTGKLPLVLSMTCYSAPFDHPTADSIGEKLLREPGKGAVAVFAASWRNGPREEWSRMLLQELLQPGTVGEALQRVKRKAKHMDLIHQYNLLGDPAMRLALPSSVGESAAPPAGAELPGAPAAGQVSDGRASAP
jgi:hypothetical protein